MLKNFLIRLTGHSSERDPGRRHDELNLPALWGGLVLLAATVASFSWSVAITSLSSLTGAWQALPIVIGAIMGLILVIVVDRAVIYLADTQGAGWRLFLAIVLRMSIIVVISAVTAQALAPWLLNRDLIAHALVLREDADLVSAQSLLNFFGIPERERALAAADSAKAEAGAASALPKALVKNEAAAKTCSEDVVRRKAKLRRKKLSEKAIAAQVRDQTQRCAAEVEAARKAIISYRAEAAESLASAISQREATARELEAAQNAYGTRLAEATAIRADAFDARSTQVLNSLLVKDPQAWWKLKLVAVLLLALEILPLLIKGLSDRSIPGARLRADHRTALLAEERRLRTAEDELRTEAQVRSAMDAGLRDALTSPALAEALQRQAAIWVETTAPLDAVRRLIAEIEAGNKAATEAMARSPDCAAFIAEVWSATTAKMIHELRRGREIGQRFAA